MEYLRFQQASLLIEELMNIDALVTKWRCEEDIWKCQKKALIFLLFRQSCSFGATHVGLSTVGHRWILWLPIPAFYSLRQIQDLPGHLQCGYFPHPKGDSAPSDGHHEGHAQKSQFLKLNAFFLSKIYLFIDHILCIRYYMLSAVHTWASTFFFFLPSHSSLTLKAFTNVTKLQSGWRTGVNRLISMQDP